MAKKKSAQFPALAEFLAGYLHQDFRAEYGDPEAAHAAYVADATAKEARALQRDTHRFLEATRSMSWPAMRDTFAALGAAWLPASRPALQRFLGRIAGSRKR